MVKRKLSRSLSLSVSFDSRIFQSQRIWLSVHSQNICNHPLLLITGHNLIYKSMLQKKFCSLEALRKLLTNSLLNDTGSCKSNQSSWLRQNNISQHGKACRYSSCCRIRQHADKQLSCFMMTFQSRRGLGHLHQRYDSLLHSGASRACKNNHRQLLLCCPLHHLCNLFSYNMAHAAHNKPGITYAHSSRKAVNHSLSGYNGLIQPRFFSGCLNLLFISREIQRIGKLHFLVPFLKGSFINQHFDPTIGMNPEISAAFGADIIIVCYILHVNGLSAFIAFSPQSLRNTRFFRFLPFPSLYMTVNYSICFFKHISQHNTSPCPLGESLRTSTVFSFYLQYSGK